MGPQLSRCPVCGGEVHAVAGRCKHCREDLVAWRARLAIGGAPTPQAARAPAPQPPANPTPAPNRAPTAQPRARTDRPAGTPPRGNPNAIRHVTLPRPSHTNVAWWKRWPLWAGAVAIFLLGLSAGMMIERQRAPAGESATASTLEGAADFGGAGEMPTNPLPSRPAPDVDPPADDPPITARPGSPDLKDPFAQSRPGTKPVAAFVDELVDIACDKLVTCGVMPGQTKSLCESLFEDYRDADADDKVATGDCRFDASAANQCLSQLGRLDCSRVSMDPSDIGTLLAGPLVTCQRSYTCR